MNIESGNNDPVCTVMCIKWGGRYGPEYVNRLRRGVQRHLHRPHRFVCFTDDASGLDAEVTALPLPELGLPQGHPDQRWRKLALLGPELFGLRGTALFLDLDLVVVDDLGPMLDLPGTLLIVRDDDLFRPKPLRRLRPERDRFLSKVGNSSVFRFEIGAHAHVVDTFLRDPASATRQYRLSQQFMSQQLMLRGEMSYWPKGWCVSFKNDCVPRLLRSYFRNPLIPEGARIVLFAGNLKMSDVLEGRGSTWYRHIGPVPWLTEMWR